MTRLFPHGVLALTGCLLVASLVCGGPTVASALAPRRAERRPLALAGQPPRPSSRVHTAWRPGMARAGRGDAPPAGPAMIDIN